MAVILPIAGTLVMSEDYEERYTGQSVVYVRPWYYSLVAYP